jgi:hypothetical protein
MGRVEGEEIRRAVMKSQPIDDSESKALAIANKNFNPRSEILRGQTLIRCEFCKKEGHSKEECWYLHPNLRPKRMVFRGDQQQGERHAMQNEEKK